MSDAEQHKAEMKKLQAKQRAKVADAADPEQGLVLVHTGNGKGKSSSAFGVIVRALGWGHAVGIVQFIKGNWVTGERQFFDKLGSVTWHTMGEGFTWDTQDRSADIAAAKETWAVARAMLADDSFDLVVLDELTYMLSFDYLPEAEILDAITSRPREQSVVVTGRGGGGALRDVMDTVSEVREVKHAYTSGIMARRGVDY